MKKRQWYKSWYIWLGLFAFPVLTYHSRHVIDKYETKLKIGYPSQRALVRKLWKNFFFGIAIMTIPSMAFALLLELLFSNAENFILEHLPMTCTYGISVYVTYRHVLWREENISHLMKSKWNEK